MIRSPVGNPHIHQVESLEAVTPTGFFGWIIILQQMTIEKEIIYMPTLYFILRMLG
jgi:hypothetical protein